MIEKIKQLYYFLMDWWTNENLKLGGVPRSPLWGKTKKEFEKLHPKKCAVCGSKKVQLHHKKSFHSNPELENDLENLVWLCEGLLTDGHHQWIGHLGNFQSINDEIDLWINKIERRPKWNGEKWVYPEPK